MSNRERLTVKEKEQIYYEKIKGKPLKQIAKEINCSFECVRKWWRIGRDEGIKGLREEKTKKGKKGILSHFEPLVAERALYWKENYPGRGPDRILTEMKTEAELAGVRLPKNSTLSAYFKEKCPHLLQKRERKPKRPPKPGQVHEMWQMDAKEKRTLGDGTIATVLQVREPVACVFLGCFAHSVQTKKSYRKLSLPEVQADLRQVFSEYGLPLALQTDRERLFGRPANEEFPTLFSLWLRGLGIEHHFSRPARPTDQAQVERGHHTWNSWMLQPQPCPNLTDYQALLDKARYMHNQVLSSHAGDCQGRIPYQAHPEVCIPIRPFVPEAELLLFSLDRVDRFLAQFSWLHTVSKSGQLSISSHNYYVGLQFASLKVIVSFDPADRHFVVSHSFSNSILKRLPAKNLDVYSITGLSAPLPPFSRPFQLPLPFTGGTLSLESLGVRP